MVRIPLIKRQPKPDSPHGEDGSAKGKDSKSKDGKNAPQPSSGVHYRGVQPAPGKDEDNYQYVLGTDKKIPLPGKGSRPGITLGQSPAVVEKTAVTLTLPESRPERQPAEAAFVARVLVPESWPEPPQVTGTAGAVVTEDAFTPVAPPEENAEELSVEATPVDEIPHPESPPEVHEATQTAEAAVAEKTPSPASTPHADQPEHPIVAEANPEAADALAMLRVMPDYIFRIGRDGISSVPRNGNQTAVGTAPGTAGVESLPDAKGVTHEADKPRPLERVIIEELPRQGEQHAKKALETNELQTFEFQVRTDKEVHHLEARLKAFGQNEVLAIVRDVTLMRQTQDALIESRNEMENHMKERNAELIRVNKMLKTEVELREEQEGVLKKNFHRLEGLLEDTIGAITLIVERRDPHVADHQRRVSLLSCAIGQEMNLRNEQMRAIRMAAQLHDLGKIFVPAEILRKPGKLSEAEMSIIKTHPDTDYEILKRIDFPISIADIVRQHHERMNGSGYPQALKGDSILVEARILAVADVIEGMVFERPYRVAPGLEAALKEIADQKGTLYDPAVVDSCLRVFTEGKFRFEALPGQDEPNGGGYASRKSFVPAGHVLDRRDF